MRILGCDPGMANFGFAILELVDHGESLGLRAQGLAANVRAGMITKNEARRMFQHRDMAPFAVRDIGVLETEKQKGVGLVERLAELEHDLGQLFDEHAPRVVVAEAPSFPRSARAAQMLGLSFGLLRGLCHGRAHLVVRTATEWRELLELPKQARGEEGKRARKASTAAMMFERFPGIRALLNVTPPGQHEHAIDALAIATSWTDKATDTGTRRAA